MPKGPKIVQETDKKVSAVCQKALSKVQNAVLHHYQAHPDSAWSGHYLVDLEKTITEIYKDMGVDIGGLFKVGLSKQMQDFYNKAQKDMVKMGKRNAILGKPDVGLVKQYLNSSYEEIAMRTTKMSFDHKRALRSMAGDVLKTASLTGASMKDVTKEFLARAQEIPGFKFTAANGAQWSNESYFRMLARTEMMNAGRAAYDAKCAKEGVDLVELSVSGHCCEACAEYEGTVFSLTGATPGYPTKQDLIDAGVFHPNCTHSYTAVPNWNLPEAEDEGEQKKEEEPQEKKTVEPEEKPAPAQKPAPEPEPAPEPVKQPEPEPAPVVVPETETPPPVDAEQAEAEQQAEEAKKSKQLTQTALDDIKKKYDAAMAEAERQMKAAEEAARKAREEEERLQRVEEELRKKAEEAKKAEENAKKVAKKKEAGFPESIDGLRHIDYLGGSTGAELVEDANGNRFVMKRGASADHVRNEFAADIAYRACGVKVPEGKIIETPDGPVKLTRYIKGKNLGKWWDEATEAEREKMKEKLRKDFAVDVVLGNRDLIGMGRDNILVDSRGNPWRIDNGAAMGFRAQGAKKDDWSTGSGADVVTMRTSKDHNAFFGDMDLLGLMKTIEKRDWSKLLDSLPEQDRKIVEKRIEEIKAAIPRTQDFKDNSGYKPQAIDEVIRASMEMNVDGLAAKIPDTIEKNGTLPDDFKWFRTGGGSPTSVANVDSKNADISKKIVDAAKTINHHNASGGDHVPNKTTLNEAYDLMPELKKLADSGNSGAAYYLHRLEQIKAAEKAGTTLNGIMVNSNISVYSLVQPQAKVDSFSSFTAYMHDYISKQTVDYNGKKIPLDPDFISRSQASQGDDSYNKEACMEKIVRLNAMGINPDDADKTYYVGHEQYQIDHFDEAKRHYMNHPEDLERDTKTYLLYQAGMQHLLENCEFAYNDPKTHTIILARTINPNLAGNTKEGELLPSTVKQGINESHSCYTARKLHTYDVRHLTLTRVPYSRISGCWMAERDPGLRNCGYLGDNENEIDADTNGLLVMLAKFDVKQGEPIDKYVKKFLSREKRRFN